MAQRAKHISTPVDLAATFVLERGDDHLHADGRWYVWRNGWHLDASQTALGYAMARCGEAHWMTPGRDGLKPDRIAGGKPACANAAIKHLPIYRGMNVPLRDLDADPNLLGLPEGQVLDLCSAVAREERRDDLVTRRTAVAPAPWKEMFIDWLLREMFPDERTRIHLQRMLGSMLWGVPMVRALAFMPGVTGAGKSMLLELLKSALDEYAAAMSSEMLTTQGASSAFEAGNANMTLEGRRFVTISEIRAKRVLDPVRINELTGNDAVVGRSIGHDTASFRPSHSILFAMNRLPPVELDFGRGIEIARAFFDRVFVYRCFHRLSQKLAKLGRSALDDPDERAAALGWLVDGSEELRIFGMPAPSSRMRLCREEWWTELEDGAADPKGGTGWV